MIDKLYVPALGIFLANLIVCVSSGAVFNQTTGFNADVDLSTWSNVGEYAGCVTCPYTCARPLFGPNGQALNFSNQTLMQSVPAAYTATKSNGCCYVDKTLSKVMPDCSNEANPPTAEPCGFLSGPSLNYSISNNIRTPANFPLMEILFASIDCELFWAIGFTYIKQNSTAISTKTDSISGSKIINHGCYGKSTGGPIVLAACITTPTLLKFDKAQTYPWQKLAQKCIGLGGRCSRTNGLWESNLKCCSSVSDLNAKWNLKYSVYMQANNAAPPLDGLAVAAIVIAGVACMMLLVHCGAKVRERAKQTALRREQEATDDYEEIITPLTGENHAAPPATSGITLSRLNVPQPASITVALNEGDMIYRPPKDDVIYEGTLI